MFIFGVVATVFFRPVLTKIVALAAYVLIFPLMFVFAMMRQMIGRKA